MRKIHTFQRYSQKENWVTNNTLLFLSRLQKYNNTKFEHVINAILQENNLHLNIGVNFFQQEKGSKSILDGSISQEEFKIAIETKLVDNFSVDQLNRHLKSLAKVPGKNQILLALSKSEVSNEIKSQVIKCIKTQNLDIKFASVSFSRMVDLIKENIAEFEVEFQETIEEFEDFCRENSLFKDDSRYMLVLTSGTSLKENLQYGIYYDPVDRSHNTEFKKIGLYANKAIVAIGDVEACVHADLINDRLEIRNKVTVSDDIKKRIEEIIRVTNYYDIREGHKFYVVDKFFQTNYKKRSYGSLRGKAYFRINDLAPENPDITAKELAEKLNEKQWD